MCRWLRSSAEVSWMYVGVISKGAIMDRVRSLFWFVSFDRLIPVALSSDIVSSKAAFCFTGCVMMLVTCVELACLL
jgi:hypothetical protein